MCANYWPFVLTRQLLPYIVILMTTTPERSATLTALVAAEIRAALGRLDIKPSQLARRLGENDQWLSTRLKGRTPINVNDLHRIATALGVGVHELLPPPDVAAGATAEVMRRYRSRTEQTPAPQSRPRDNRPGGHPATAGVRRSSLLPRPHRPREA